MTNNINFQKSTLKIKCRGCKDTCELVYDSHHDQTFGTTCGIVIMESNNILIDYPAQPLFWQQQKERRDNIKELKKILNKIKELNIEYTITDDLEITMPSLTIKEQSTLTNMCTDTVFKLILEKKYDKNKKYLGSQFIIKKEKKEEKK